MARFSSSYDFRTGRHGRYHFLRIDVLLPFYLHAFFTEYNHHLVQHVDAWSEMVSPLPFLLGLASHARRAKFFPFFCHTPRVFYQSERFDPGNCPLFLRRLPPLSHVFLPLPCPAALIKDKVSDTVFLCLDNSRSIA